MKDGPLQLMLDSLAIGIVASTVLLEAILILDVRGTGSALEALGILPLTLIWVHLTILTTPFGTLILLARGAD
ncbi:hypothetical protein JSE7799_03630 [Jannaschia seosinensis]|uniref:Uncharacterized protein n=1 Tax=Jannaschia seosinensis TaxID=313367 RepID=A0A0M7BDT6_9RHOB|nr:hypothetical protein [Jannaschia seosinensis]CUH40890.1 hypothetical protein JSE7799_03630 [Jannaschia seosinensis]